MFITFKQWCIVYPDLSCQMESPLDHSFINYQVSIMQSCDQCNSYIWAMEKAYMCTCE